MTPVQMTETLERSTTSDRPHPNERPTLVTRSETVECNCPDHCERDHEVD